MKILCAWCGGVIAIMCTHCKAPLLNTNYVGSTFSFDKWNEETMCCLNGEIALLYSQSAIDRMPIEYGLCNGCAAMPELERDQLLRRRYDQQGGLPTPEQLDRIVQERKTAAAHEASTRTFPRGQIRQAPELKLLQTQEQSKKKGVPKG